MKKCPYCAEEIQDEAILCRYCHSDLSAPFPQGKGTAPASGASPATASPAGAGEAATSASPGTWGATTPATAPAAQQGDAPATSGPTTTGTSTSGATGAGADDEMWGVKNASPTVATPVEGPGATITYTHTGQRYVLGYGDDHFGIWDRQTPDAPAERFPRTDDGWRQAWQRYAGLEPGNVAVEPAQAAPTTGAAQPATSTGPAPTATSASGGFAGGATAPIQSAGVSQGGGSAATQYTHSGQRYLLGYGGDFFGIWDRNQLSEPVRRYPRTDAGWRQAWQEFVAWEPNSVEVGIGG